MKPITLFQLVVERFSSEKANAKKKQEKLQKQFWQACYSNSIEDILEDLQNGASFEFYGDPAYGLKELLELPTNVRYLNQIFTVMGGVKPELLGYPVERKKTPEQNAQNLSIFQYVLKDFFPQTIQTFIEHAHSIEVLDIMLRQTKEQGIRDEKEASFYQPTIDLIQARHKILTEKALISEALSTTDTLSEAPKLAGTIETRHHNEVNEELPATVALKPSKFKI